MTFDKEINYNQYNIIIKIITVNQFQTTFTL